MRNACPPSNGRKTREDANHKRRNIRNTRQNKTERRNNRSEPMSIRSNANGVEKRKQRTTWMERMHRPKGDMVCKEWIQHGIAREEKNDRCAIDKDTGITKNHSNKNEGKNKTRYARERETRTERKKRKGQRMKGTRICGILCASPRPTFIPPDQTWTGSLDKRYFPPCPKLLCRIPWYRVITRTCMAQRSHHETWQSDSPCTQKRGKSMQVHSYTETNQETHTEKRSFETPTCTCEKEERVVKPWLLHGALGTRKLRMHGGSDSFKGVGKHVRETTRSVREFDESGGHSDA